MWGMDRCTDGHMNRQKDESMNRRTKGQSGRQKDKGIFELSEDISKNINLRIYYNQMVPNFFAYSPQTI